MKNRLERESLSPRRDLMQVTDKLFIHSVAGQVYFVG